MAENKRDYYEELGVDKNADADALKKAAGTDSFEQAFIRIVKEEQA